ncbi:MAG: radical SAM protein [Anaerolineales bacterium]|nr:radical SAM protein [Anaerolineales bacterium]
MKSFLSRWFPIEPDVEPLDPGVYHYQASEDSPIPYRLHLRIEADGRGILIVNASTVVHLNETATEYAYQLVHGAEPKEAAIAVSQRYRVTSKQAQEDFEVFSQRVLALATNPDIDPVLFLDIDRTEPMEIAPSAPYRLDLALTYLTDPDGEQDPLARARVDRELTTEEWTRILETAWNAGIPHVTFTGGEPTRRYDLKDLVKKAEELGQVTGVFSDGRRLSDAANVEELSQAGLDHFLIVLVPDSQESFEGLRNALASDVFTAVHFTITKELIGEVSTWLDRLHKMGVQAISISGSDLSEEVTQAIADAREQAAELEMDLIWDLPAPYSQINPIALEVSDAPDRAGRAWLYVEPDGDVLPDQRIDRILGNILTDPWDEIWAAALQS